MAADYKITTVQPYTYLDQAGMGVQGFRVFFEVLEFGEVAFIHVPRMDNQLIKTEIEAYVAKRKKLATL